MRANHAGRTRLSRQSNSCAIGIECEASGARPIEGVQLDAYVRIVRALCDHYGIDRTARETHSAILDCQLLAKVYRHLTGAN